MNELAGSPASRRATTVAGIPSFRMLTDYLGNSDYACRQREPGVCDFAFGNPHEMPPAAYVDALREALEPQNEEWFAYQMNSPVAQAAASAALRRLVGVAFEPEDFYLTTGAFSDIALLQRKRDRIVESLTWMGYEVRPCEGTFYLFVTSPTPDDTAFTDDLAQRGVFVLPGTMFETPGFFRISLTASEDTIERSLPLFADALSRARLSDDTD